MTKDDFQNAIKVFFILQNIQTSFDVQLASYSLEMGLVPWG